MDKGQKAETHHEYITYVLREYNLVSPGHVFSSTTDNVNTNFAAVKLLGIEHPIGCVCHLLDLSLA